jgi:hypothetical protein
VKSNNKRFIQVGRHGCRAPDVQGFLLPGLPDFMAADVGGAAAFYLRCRQEFWVRLHGSRQKKDTGSATRWQWNVANGADRKQKIIEYSLVCHCYYGPFR